MKESKSLHLEMFTQENRLKSFKNWMYGNNKPCSAQKLAEAGFFWIGSSEEIDSVQCFLCCKKLDGWEPNDNPWDEHLNHSKHCSFAKLRLPEDEQTWEQFLTFRHEQLQNIIELNYNNHKKQRDQVIKAIRDTASGFK